MRDPIEIFEDALMRRPRLWRAWVWLNPCKEAYADGAPKVDGPLFKAFAAVFYLKCSCCAAIRGLAIGLAAGFLLGVLS